MKKLSGSAAARLMLIASMFVFGTIGIFVRYIPLPSSIIAFVRGAVGVIFLLLVCLIGRKKISFSAIKSNILILIFSGVAIGVNWIFLFEAYRYTTVATATLCYYLSPVFVMIVSPIFLRERLTARKLIGVLAALVGMIFVSGIHRVGISGISEMRGILFGILAAMFYASVIIMNKKLHDISAYDRTIVQLAVAALTVLPYGLLTEDMASITLDATVIILLLVVGIVHTGISYAMYFSSINALNAQTVALFSYIDPIVAILLSATVLKEGIDIFGIIGAVLILSSMYFSNEKEKKVG